MARSQSYLKPPFKFSSKRFSSCRGRTSGPTDDHDRPKMRFLFSNMQKRIVSASRWLISYKNLISEFSNPKSIFSSEDLSVTNKSC